MTIKQQGGIFGRNPTFNDVNVDGGLFVGDNVKVNIGDSQDMQLYHDGSNSIIEDAGSGNVEIRSNTTVIRKATNAENHIYCQSNGSVILYHDGAPKIYTQSYGASLLGNLAFESGSGIDFSATSGTGTSELFDDYEEGTWTPSVASGAISGTSVSYSGSYTKVGNKVTVTFNANNTAGDIQISSYAVISGLPFTASSSEGGSSTITTEDIDQFSRQGFAAVGNGSSNLALSAAGSATGTVKLIVSLTYLT